MKRMVLQRIVRIYHPYLILESFKVLDPVTETEGHYQAGHPRA
jgi:hypothetical protein